TPVPIIAALPRDPKYYTPRDLLVVPFGVLIMMAGVEWLIATRRRVAAAATALLLLTIPVQFSSFVRNYFGEYQTWSASRFDPLNLRGTAAYLAGSEDTARAPAIYLSEDVGEGQANQWLFQLLAAGRHDIWAKSRPFITDQIHLDQIPPGSLLVLDASNPRLDRFRTSAHCADVHIVNGPAGAPASAVLRWS